MKSRNGLTGLALILLGESCIPVTRTIIAQQKGVCAREDLNCDPDKTYTPTDKCYEFVNRWNKDHPIPIATYSSSSSSSSSSRDIFDSDPFKYHREISNNKRGGHYENCP